MISPSDLSFNPDVLPAEGVLHPNHLRRLQQLFGANAKLVVTSSCYESIPRLLHASDIVEGVPALTRPKVIGILAGAPNGNLVAVGFPDKEAMAGFLAANQALTGALVTTWNGFCLVWLYTDFMARNIEEPEVLWVSQGIVPISHLDDIVQVHQHGKPTQVRYNDIVWPERMSGIFRFELLRSVYGDPYPSIKRKVVLNLNFWAAWTIDRLRLVFDPRTDAFLRMGKADDQNETLGPGAVTELVTNFLQRCATLDAKRFPMTEIRPRRIQELISLVKTMSILPALSEPASLEEYLGKGLRQMPSANVTAEELWQGYKTFFDNRRDVALYPECEFRRISPLRVRQLFGKSKVNSVLRGGKARKGYNGICLAPWANGNPNHSSIPGQIGEQHAGLAGGPAASTATVGASSDVAKDSKDSKDAKDAGMGNPS